MPSLQRRAAASVFRIACLAVVLVSSAVGAEPVAFKLESPRAHQVVQRTGTAPGAGYANVVVRGDLPAGTELGDAHPDQS